MYNMLVHEPKSDESKRILFSRSCFNRSQYALNTGGIFKFVNLFPAELFRIELFGIISGAVAKKYTHTYTYVWCTHWKSSFIGCAEPKLIYRAYLYIDCGINVATGQNNHSIIPALGLLYLCATMSHSGTYSIRYIRWQYYWNVKWLTRPMPYRKENAYARIDHEANK